MYKGNHKSGEIEITKELKVYENKFCEFFNDEVIFPSGFQGNYLRLKMKGDYSVAILPITKNGEMVFIKTFRHATRSWGYEVPKGYGESNEKPLNCAIRELKEETGLTSQKFIYVGLYHESPSTVQNGLHCYIALDCEKSDEVNLENSEVIDSHIYVKSFDELEKLGYNDAITEMLVCKYELENNLKRNKTAD